MLKEFLSSFLTLPHSCCGCHVDLSMFPFVSVRLLLKKSVVNDRDCVLINNLSKSHKQNQDQVIKMSVTITHDSLFQHYFYLDDKTTPPEFNCPIIIV